MADDDHGPLALQEILLAGCPTVGVKTGDSFVRDGVTGYVGERLPPGWKCVETDADRECLEIYLEAIRRAQELDRQDVRSRVAGELEAESIVNGHPCIPRPRTNARIQVSALFTKPCLAPHAMFTNARSNCRQVHHLG